MSRSRRDWYAMHARLSEARLAKGTQNIESLTVEEQRKCGYTPPGFKSSQPKPRSP